MRRSAVLAVFSLIRDGGRRSIELRNRDRERLVMVWGELDEREKRRILQGAVERVVCDRRKRQATIRLKPEMTTDSSGEERTVHLSRGTAVERRLPPKPALLPAQCTASGRPRLTQLMALALRLEELLANGTAKDYADLARLGGVSRARITQILNLRHLAPAIQEEILSLHGKPCATVSERDLRRVSAILDWRRQMKLFEKLRGSRVAPRSLPRSAPVDCN